MRKSWGDLERPQYEPPKPSRLDAVCAELLTGSLGQEFLKLLRHQHFETGGNSHGTEAELRVRIANQMFIRNLESARDRGLAANKPA